MNFDIDLGPIVRQIQKLLLTFSSKRKGVSLGVKIISHRAKIKGVYNKGGKIVSGH